LPTKKLFIEKSIRNSASSIRAQLTNIMESSFKIEHVVAVASKHPFYYSFNILSRPKKPQ